MTWPRRVGVSVVVVACLIGAFLLTDPIVRGLHDVTGGNRAADFAAGVLLFWVPLAVVCVVAGLNERRRGLRLRDAWLAVLMVPAFDLEPFSRAGTNAGLDDRINALLPGYLAGLLVAVLLLSVPVLAYGLVVRLRRRRTAR